MQERFRAYIEKHTSLLGGDKNTISVSITDIAFLMGQQECLTLIKEAIEKQRERQREFSFFAGPLSTGGSEEKKDSTNSADIRICELRPQGLPPLN